MENLFVVNLEENLACGHYIASPWLPRRLTKDSSNNKVDVVLPGYYAIGPNKHYQLFVRVEDDHEMRFSKEPTSEFEECPTASYGQSFSRLDISYDTLTGKRNLKIVSADMNRNQKLLFVSVIAGIPSKLRLVILEEKGCEHILEYIGASPKCVSAHYFFKMTGSDPYFIIGYGEQRRKITWNGVVRI